MNDFQKQAMKKYIELNYLFLSIYQDQESDEEKIKLMTQNHNMMRHALSDLGVEFKEKDEIRKLNQRIHEMEKNQISSDLNYQKISTYINNLKHKLDNDLKAMGISSSNQVSFAPNIQVSINLFSSSIKKSNPSYYKTEEEYLESCRKNEERHNLFLKNFISFGDDQSKSERYLAYDDSNINSILNIVSKSIGEEITGHNFTLTPRYSRKEGEVKMLMPMLNTIDIRFATLASHKSFIESFRNLER